MKVKNIKIFTLFLFIFVSSGSFAQYKYDIGLKASSYEMERFQLEQRIHLNSPFSIVVTFATGSRGSGSYLQSSIYNDSLVDISNNFSNATNNTLKVGVQRKLGFLETDVFYVGATLGIGFEQQRDNFFTATYLVDDSSQIYPSAYSQIDYGNEISSSHIMNSTNAINAQLALSFGMDVPITKRFSINAEVACAALYRKSFNYQYTGIYFQPSFSGGLRYSFGKRG